MPTYIFECDTCHIQKELVFSINKCPKFVKCLEKDCNGLMQKVITGGTGFILKGGGWPGKDILEKNNRNERSKQLSNTMDEKRRAGEGVKKITDLK